MPATEPALLHGFRLRNAERNLGVYGIHLHREGHEPVEHRFRADDLVHLYSGSKTVTALAIGIARAEGLLELDDAVISFFPGYRYAEGVEAMTVHDLLRMASGNTFTWWLPGQLEEPDLLGAFLTSELVAEPGSRFDYSNGCSYVLSRIVHAVSGQDLRDYLMSRLFEPLRIRNPQWMRCPQGFSQGAIGLHLRTAQFARIGQLLLQDGRGTTDRLFGIQSTVGFQIDNQLVQVGTLLDTSILDHISHATNRAEGRIELKTTDATGLVFVALTRVSRLIATAASDLELHVDRTIGRQIGDQVIAIDDFDIVIQLDIAGGDRTCALL